MIRPAVSLRVACALSAVVGAFACSSAASRGSGGTGGDGGSIEIDGGTGDAPVVFDGPPGSGGDSVIYATTNTELWKMDPVSKAVTLIGAFTGFSSGSGGSHTITDIAVDGAGEIFVNTTTDLYRAALPAGGTGSVTVTFVRSIVDATSSTQKFYALGFAPAGVLESGEGLVAGDNAGDLYYVPVTGGAAPLLLGGFGSIVSGGPGDNGINDHYELSGDVVFFSVAGGARGLASLRACGPGAKGHTTCDTTNDIIAEIDMTALQAKTGGNLRKRFLGTGTGFGRMFGIGAWQDKVFGFTDASSKGGTQAELISIGADGNGASLASFPSVTQGWTGAGVTTKASITIIN